MGLTVSGLRNRNKIIALLLFFIIFYFLALLALVSGSNDIWSACRNGENLSLFSKNFGKRISKVDLSHIGLDSYSSPIPDFSLCARCLSQLEPVCYKKRQKIVPDQLLVWGIRAL